MGKEHSAHPAAVVIGRFNESPGKAFIYRDHGINRRTGDYEIDHLIPLGVGGADVATNCGQEVMTRARWRRVRPVGITEATKTVSATPERS